MKLDWRSWQLGTLGCQVLTSKLRPGPPDMQGHKKKKKNSTLFAQLICLLVTSYFDCWQANWTRPARVQASNLWLFKFQKMNDEQSFSFVWFSDSVMLHFTQWPKQSCLGHCVSQGCATQTTWKCKVGEPSTAGLCQEIHELRLHFPEIETPALAQLQSQSLVSSSAAK